MSDEAVAATETADVTDSQVNEFFESGGELKESQPEAVEAKPEAEKVEEAAPEKEEVKEEKPDKVVPYGALHEERMRRKELQQQVETYGERTQKMEEAFQKLVERSQKAAEPSFEDSPLEALRHQNEQLEQRLKHYDDRFSQTDQQQQQYRQQQEFVSQYQQQAQEFAKETPDFQDAYKHLVSTRQQELEGIGYSSQEAANMLVQEEAMIVGKAMQDGVNPAERMFNLAKMRGWAAKPATKEVSNPPEAAKPGEAERKLEALAKGKEASGTLSGGGKGGGNITLESLADMMESGADPAEIDKMWEKLVGPNR